MSFTTIEESECVRLARYVAERLRLPMIAYEILTENKIYDWHLDMDVDGMSKLNELLERGHGSISDWLDNEKFSK